MLLQGFDVLFYGDSITMRWRDDWPANQWGVGPPPANTPGGTPMGVFNETFRTNYTSEILGIGSEPSRSGLTCLLTLTCLAGPYFPAASSAYTFCMEGQDRACELDPEHKSWAHNLPQTGNPVNHVVLCVSAWGGNTSTIPLT